MKLIYFLSLLVLAASSSNVYADSSILRVVCTGDDVGAEVSVNGKFKGECPLDVKVPMGTLKLKVQKKVDAFNDRIFEQEIGVDYAVVKRVVVLLGAPQLNAEGQRVQSEQLKIAKTNEKQVDEKLKACTFCPEMVPIPGTDFEIGKYTVTFDEWDACVADGGCDGYVPAQEEIGRGLQPVINVSWNDAQNYIEWLSNKTGKTYRLPSEREWQIAARAGTTTQYYWGNELGSKNANCRGCDNDYAKKKYTTTQVGSYPPNPYGLYDMLGNVWEWTDGCREGDCAKLVLRGGSFEYEPEYLTARYREGIEATERINNLGFRLARTLP
ncbi:formylglycine-generating enzyme family protein [Candidatus Nitrotoga sp. M5]|uniref:formylglycine-generating enzyme family protein n=1 Tax=Candidatus Nitrotoga sp. M5 TaxID=2890409 RepID=UPI001EF2E267|nr:formylglycine-generating enzyme family protein [Candidatus Nitrotoga sp. M5]CAH1386431.1 Formylglycine-generating enzyme, required for sulfatase activity, contains SUMF1/FGE domain [Candidatus Nitrotoga sp. M5]